MLQWLFPQLEEHPFLLVLSLGLSCYPLREFFRLLFDDLQGFADDVVTAAPPDWVSFLRGRLDEDRWAEFKIGLFVLGCIAMPTALYRLGSKLLA